MNRVYYWGNDPAFRSLSPAMQMAIVARMEADQGLGERSSGRYEAAAMLNRGARGGYDPNLDFFRRNGSGYERYQPLNEPAQYQRLSRLSSDPATTELAVWIDKRRAGEVPDPVNGATHFGATIPTMEALSAREPNKYKTWRTWMTPQARVSLDGDDARRGHWFYAPEGRHSLAPGAAPQTASNLAKTDMFDAPDAHMPTDPALPKLSLLPLANAPQASPAPSTSGPVASAVSGNAGPDWSKLIDGIGSMPGGAGGGQGGGSAPPPVDLSSMAQRLTWRPLRGRYA